MWNWMSAAGSPARVRTNAHTSATVEVSGPLPPQQPLRQEARLLGGVEGVSVAHREQRGEERMVLQVPARRRAARGGPIHAGRAQLVAGADAGQLQQLRRADRAGAEQHLALGAQRPRSPRRPWRTRTPTARSPSSSRPSTRGAGADLEVRAVQCRAQVGVGGAEAPAVRWVTWNIETPSCSGPL